MNIGKEPVSDIINLRPRLEVNSVVSHFIVWVELFNSQKILDEGFIVEHDQQILNYLELI